MPGFETLLACDKQSFTPDPHDDGQMFKRWADDQQTRRRLVLDEAVEAVLNDRDLLPDSAVNQRLRAGTVKPALLLHFHRYVWAARSHYAQRWLLSVLVFDLALIAFDWTMNSRLLGPALLVRGVGLTGILGYLYVVWGRPRSGNNHPLTLILIAVAIMTAAGTLGMLGGAVTLERFLTAGLFTVATAILFIPVGFRWTIWSIVVAIAIDVIFVAAGPSGDPVPAFLMVGFYGTAVLSLAGGRGGLDSLWRSFLSRIREARYQQELTRLNAELRVVADLDPLTGIPNRRSAQAHVDRLWRDGLVRKSGVAFVMADIDHFKHLNDTFGHAVGDTCIQAVAVAIRSTLRDGDIVSRHGGEEFLIVLAHTTLSDAASSAERIREAVTALRIDSPGKAAAPVVTISLGVAMADDRFGAERTMSRADEALYEAKRNGRDRVEIAPDETLARQPHSATPTPSWCDRAA